MPTAADNRRHPIATPPEHLFDDPAAYDGWARGWRARLAQEPPGRVAAMRLVNPAYIPRNHLVEEALPVSVGQSAGNCLRSFHPFFLYPSR